MQRIKKLPRAFYERPDVTLIARELIGKVLVTRIGGEYTSGRIVETEAYAGQIDRASHAFGGRRTDRTEVMYGRGGTAYVYLCYGIHHLFNVVTHEADTPHAVLIRGIEPLEGMEVMLRRTGKVFGDKSLGRGPGNVSVALGIRTTLTGASLLGNDIYIAEDAFVFAPEDIVASPRIGVDYAGEDALLPYRFSVRGHAHVSKAPRAARTSDS
ncbi:DNA-3-methyladenine glycosylase [Dinghuibacter silviterrae]|uniref:Putative 3-methyladenine DNA glycosylase n=1 Tax=Dinghuibacter silviterrae TaxID=1539049 RepID=A0A4R8DPJ0_9BACT|nr:DNA-3-methyladenine glycosylase [Dinghuibacter silviterrae]TDW99334.1 DNA-3-methyladenine glycosylase [Dinghuibacter silviterrae]